MSEFKAITTQEDFDKAISDRLTRQKESILKDYQDYDSIKERNGVLEKENAELKGTIEGYSGEKDNHEKELASLNEKIKSHELRNLKVRIAMENGIPYSLADRLQGYDEDSILSDAKKLSDYVAKSKPVAPLKTMDNVVDKNASYKKLLEGIEGE